MALRDFVIRRVVDGAILFFMAITLNFFLFRIMPGDPTAFFIENPKFSPETRKALIEMFGLNRPLWEQYARYVMNAFTFNFGISFQYLRPVREIIFGPRLINTLALMIPATVLATLLGVFIGTIAAWRRGSKFDASATFMSLLFYSIPVYWLGLLIILVFAYYLGLLPFRGSLTPGAVYTSPLDFLADYLWHMTGPLMTLTLINFGGYLLIMRSNLLDVFSQDYIVAAKAKGLSDRTILFSYGMRNAIIPVVTLTGLNMAFSISGAVLTETVFSWYGMGRLIFEAVNQRDYPILEGVFFLLALLVIIANIVMDIIYAYLDPRIRY
ncbi:peptide ABC transporter permease [Candidatus Geothermarchaeota archaeon ex4572_27]|nr:MAG: peptide ABC transporter permease [Candidatus Geothermarchaeota archaeon ex4572_27]